jgi:hypothetical protein
MRRFSLAALTIAVLGCGTISGHSVAAQPGRNHEASGVFEVQYRPSYSPYYRPYGGSYRQERRFERRAWRRERERQVARQAYRVCRRDAYYGARRY